MRAHNFKDLTGMKFGRLTVIRFSGTNKHQQALWLCKCDCGTQKILNRSNLIGRSVRSCGCLKKEQLVKRLTKHSMASSKNRSSLYTRWAGIKSRCNNPNEPAFKNYGARGITVCDEWLEFEPFAKWALKNGYKENLEIDRIDNDKGYSPENCRWVTPQQNQLNKRNNRLIEINGVTKTLSEWSLLSGISIQTISSRIRYGWDKDDLLLPVGQYNKNPRKRDKFGRFTSARTSFKSNQITG